MPGSKPIQSVTRAMDVLEAVGRAGARGTTLQELARELGLKAPTLHNFLRTLLARNWLERDESAPRYRLGAAFLAAAAGERGSRFLQEAGRAMLRLAALCPQATVSLATYVAPEVVVCQRVSPQQPGVVEESHNRLHPYGSASPLLFQAFWSDEERAAYRQAHPFWENGGGEIWKSVARLETFLAGARETRAVLLVLPGEAMVKAAVPVSAPGGAIRYALGVSVSAPCLPAAKRAAFFAALTAEAEALTL